MRWRTSWFSLFVLVAACAASGDWTRDGTSRDVMEADLLACDSAARAHPAVPGPRAPRGSVHPDAAHADPLLDLAQRVDRCMRGRGYSFEARRRLLL